MEIDKLASLVVAFCALFVAVWSSYQTRKHYRLTVRPVLGISNIFRGESEFYGVRLVNAGPGPAVLHNFGIYFLDEPVEDSHQGWIEALKRAGLFGDDWHLYRPRPGSIIKSGESIWLLRTKSLKGGANNAIVALSKIEVRAIYSSLYGEKQPEFSKFMAGEDQVILREADENIV